MRAYITVTGLLFLALTIAHVWRFFVERNLTTDPFFIAVTIISTGMSIWAITLLRRRSAS
jgi:hypothetical protein